MSFGVVLILQAQAWETIASLVGRRSLTGNAFLGFKRSDILKSSTGMISSGKMVIRMAASLCVVRVSALPLGVAILCRMNQQHPWVDLIFHKAYIIKSKLGWPVIGENGAAEQSDLAGGYNRRREPNLSPERRVTAFTNPSGA